jgi:WXG100 family type VII secretion target
LSADKVQVDYEELDSVAARFTRLASDADMLRLTVRRHVAALEEEGWQGQGATDFYAEMEEVILPAMGRLTEALEEAGNASQRIQPRMRAAEEAASVTLK